MFIYQIKSHSRGVIKNFFNNPVVQYDYNTKDNIQIKKAIERLSQFFLDREVEFILFPVENSFPVKNLKDAKHLSDRFNQKLHLVSVHGMSSMRPDQLSSSLTDYYGKLKGFKNIFISDASILPGNTGESPQASIMAYTKFIANNIKL